MLEQRGLLQLIFSESINFHKGIQNSIILSNIRKYNRETLSPADEIYSIFGIHTLPA